MASITLAGIGELLWDILPNAVKLGGAPINFAYHAQSLGAAALPISTVGSDRRGKEALEQLANHGLDTATISVTHEYATGYVTAELDSRGIASYTFPEDIAWDHLHLNQAARQAADTIDAVCFGSLAQRSTPSRETIRSFLAATPAGCCKIFDLNLRQHFYNSEVITDSLRQADIFKLNDEELDQLAQMLTISGSQHELLRLLQQRFNLQLVALTRGAHGSLLLSGDQFSDHPGFPAEIVDTVGAGDAFTAATSLGFLLHHELEAINAHANALAAYVCSQSGAMPTIPDTFKLC